MVIEIDSELAAALETARAAGDAALVRTCELTAVADSTEAYSVKVAGDSVEAAFPELDRMVNDKDVPIEHARQLRLYLALKGHLESQFMEGENFRLGRNIVQDYVLARYWLAKAAERGHSAAQNNLGVMYADGLGGAVDSEMAVYWYIKGAESGDYVAKSNLAMHLTEGRGTRRNYAMAAKLFKESLRCDPYNARDHRLLAECYEHGVAGRNGLRMAIHHYQEASDFGSLKARAALRRLSRRVQNPGM
ncbi:MAG: sel1 repeat family protein [Kiritimatiellae bacterium]|nr:sel1 repeat family protein [Kiritimatiellia bacterium]